MDRFTFLEDFVRKNVISTILELGTGQGYNSAKAMLKGGAKVVVTIDKIDCLKPPDDRIIFYHDDLLLVDVTIATPFPEKVDRTEVLTILPEGQRRITVVEGGILYPTPHNKDLPFIHPVVMAVATVVVLFDIEKSKVTS